MTKDTNSVDFTFNKAITIGNINSDFSETVTQPFNHIEPVHRLTFDLNGSNGIVPDEQVTKTRDLAKIIDNPIRKAYTFMGWNTASDGGGTKWDFATTTMPNCDVTLYAQWQC